MKLLAAAPLLRGPTGPEDRRPVLGGGAAVGVRPALPVPLERRRPAALPRAAADRRARLVPPRRGLLRGAPALRAAGRRRRALARRALARRPRPRLARHHRPRLRSLLLPLGRGASTARSTSRRPLRLAAAGLATGAAFATKFSAPILVPVFLARWAFVARRPRRLATAPRPRRVPWPCSSSGRPTASARALARPRGARQLRAPLDAPVVGPRSRGVRRRGTRASCRRTTRAALLFVMTHSEARAHLPRRGAVRPRLPALLPLHDALEDADPAAAPGRPRRGPRPAPRPPARASSSGCRSSCTLAFTFTRGLQIGHRHLLPLYPFLFVAAGRGGGLAARRGAARPGSSSPRRSPSGTRAARCATTRTTSRTSTRSRAARRTASGSSWTRTSTGART